MWKKLQIQTSLSDLKIVEIVLYKDQLISKAICGVLDSPKKRMKKI